MKFKKIIIIALMGFMIFSVLPKVTTYAASSSLSGPSTVRTGDTIYVTLNLSDASWYGASGSITWDSSQLTFLSSSGASGWNVSPPDSGSSNFTAITTDGNTRSGNVGIVTLGFRVNSNTSITVSASNIRMTLENGSEVSANSSTYSKTITAPSTPSTPNTPSTPSTPSNPSGSSVNTLKSLSVAEGGISPAFDPNTTEYTLTVSYTVAALNITAAPTDSKARVSVASNDLKAGKVTPVSVVVTAENGAQKTYVINTTREHDPNYVASANNSLASLVPSYGALSPAFNKDITYYAINVPYECEQMLFTAAPEDVTANCIVLGNPSLAAGTDNLFHVVCTAEDNSVKIYTITVRRATTYNLFITDEYTDSIIAQIEGQNKPIVIDMSKSPVQIISSKILSALKENPARILIIKTLNGRITVKGADLNADIAEGFYDFTLNNSSQYAEKLLSEGASGENAVFSTHFQQLPGYAQFAVYTNLTSGLNVNVYRYDKDNDKYITVAKNIQVNGGTVTFECNTGGDFLITTKTIPGASKSDALSKQSSGMTNYLIMIGAGLLGIIIGFGLGFLGKKHQSSGSSKSKTDRIQNNKSEENKKQKKKKLFHKEKELKNSEKTADSEIFEDKPAEGIEAIIDNLTNKSENIE